MPLFAHFSTIIYLAAALVLFTIGKWFFSLVNRSFNLSQQLVCEDNLALALVVGGYFIGLTFSIGGVLQGNSTSLLDDLISIAVFGAIGILLLNFSISINKWLILDKVHLDKEIIEDRNCGVGMIEAANHVATGLIIYGTLGGEGGGIVQTLVFWLLGQSALVAASRLYGRMVPYDVQDAIEKDNVAVGVAFAGMLLAIGNLVRIAVHGTFVSWGQSLGSFAVVVIIGLVSLPIVRLITDKVILPGHHLTDELVNQVKPNIGAGIIEAVLYVSASFLIGWCL